MTDISQESRGMVTNNTDPKIVHALSGQLNWTHFRKIIHIKDDEPRFIIWAPAFIGFYAWLIDSNVITGILRRRAV
jgi:hypothetical protein